MDVESPEHTVCERGEAVTTGAGVTVIVTLTGRPTQPVAVTVGIIL